MWLSLTNEIKPNVRQTNQLFMNLLSLNWSLFLNWMFLGWLFINQSKLLKDLSYIAIVSLTNTVKGSIFLKNRHFFFSQERFNKLIYGIDTIIKCGIWQPVKFQLISHFWSGSKMKWFLLYFYCISEIILVLIPYINLLNLSWIIRYLFFEVHVYGVFNPHK